MILATCRVPGHPYGRKTAGVLRVEGGLHFIKGNRSPYFSLTGSVHRLGFPGQDWECGCIHETILKRFPRFADLAALHLSDMDGCPSHAAANGLYWVAGAMGGLGRKYHGGSGSGARSPAECREIAKRHFRCTESELDSLIIDCTRAEPEKAVAAFVDGLRARWRVEAAACIERHGLQVFGDVTAWHALQANAATAAEFAETLRRLHNVTCRPGAEQ